MTRMIHYFYRAVLPVVLTSLLFHGYIQTAFSQSTQPLLSKAQHAKLLAAMKKDIKVPTSLSIPKVQQAIRSASMNDANVFVDAKLDEYLEQLIPITTTTKKLPSMSTSMNSDINSHIHINPKNEVLVDVVGKTWTGKTLKTVLTENGYKVINSYMNSCSVHLPINRIEHITKIPEVLKVDLAMPSRNHRQQQETQNHRDDVKRDIRRHLQSRDLQGSVLSEAVKAMYVDTASRRYGNINGTGITVGILSDSFDCQGNQAQIDVQTGDLPPLSRINVLADLEVGDVENCTDEGRAMMQLVYDIAPGVNFAFHTAFRGQADVAAGILALADAGCQIIVDDVVYFREPFFQDGIISLAVDEVASKGVSYFTSVGNSNTNGWDGNTGFTNSSIQTLDGDGYFHSYGLDENGDQIILQPFITAREFDRALLAFQWDEPSISPNGNGGSRSDLDIYVFDQTGAILTTKPRNNLGRNPAETKAFNPKKATYQLDDTFVVVFVAIVLKYGPAPAYMKIVSYPYGLFNFSDGSSATNYGHKNSASGASVGAAFYADTPAYGVSPPIAEYYSSNGGTPILFDADSNRLPVPEIRPQPRFVGPDGVSTSDMDFDPFYGTSASAPNVAGVAALMLQLHASTTTTGGRITPHELFDILEFTAIDMTTTIGFDFQTGYGFVNASSALDAVFTLTSPVPCTVTWDVYNSKTNKFVSTIVGNGTTIQNPPPCGRINIEAIVPSLCRSKNITGMTIELYRNDRSNHTLIRSKNETAEKYFLFGNRDNSINDGTIKDGIYKIRAIIRKKSGKIVTPFTTFALATGRCN